MRGTKSNLIIRQGEAEGYRPELYIEVSGDTDPSAFSGILEDLLWMESIYL